MALVAMVPWSRRGLSAMVFVSLMLIIVYYPNGEDALYNWPYLLACAVVAALAAVSLHRPDPLRLAAGARTARAAGMPVPQTAVEREAESAVEQADEATPEQRAAAQPGETDPAAEQATGAAAAGSVAAPAATSPAVTPAGAEQRAG
jgi:alpha-1,6-mannosyltransferase